MGKSPRKSPGPPQPPMELYLQEAERQEREVEAVAASAPLDDLFRAAEAMQEAKRQHDEFAAKSSQFKAEYDKLRLETIPDLMKARGLVQSNGKGSFTFSGGKVHLETSLHASCVVANKPKLFQWLRRNKLGDIIKEDVSATVLASLVKERREAGQSDPPLLSIHEQVKAKLTALKA